MTVTDTPPSAPEGTPALKDGRVVAIAGPVVDVEFPRGSLPEINHAVHVDDQPRRQRGAGHR